MKEKHCLSKRSRSSGGVIKIIANFKCCLPQTTLLDFFLLCMLLCVTSLSVSGVKKCFVRLESGICSCFMEQWGTCTDLGGSGAGAHSAQHGHATSPRARCADQWQAHTFPIASVYKSSPRAG